MTQPKVIKLKQYERVVAVVPFPASGAIGKVSILAVYVVDDYTSKLRVQYLQLDDLTPSMRELIFIGGLVCQQMLAAVPVKKTRARKG